MFKESRACSPFLEYWYGTLCSKNLHKKTTVTYIDGDYVKEISLSVGTYYEEPYIHFCDADIYCNYTAWVDCTGMTWEDTVTDEAMIREYTFADGVKVRLVTDLSKRTRAKSAEDEDTEG